LNAVVGGGLVEARNKALDDAQKEKKVCVQISDDISHWMYFTSSMRFQDLDEGNKAAKGAIRISPVTAARFLVAKMRGSPLDDKPKLGGVFPLGNMGMGALQEPFSFEHFILGDFFVHDMSSCRFDRQMTLKEDYDFTCSHLARHGSVVRCNRMFANAMHERNEGGACSLRDAKGQRERENIQVLREKWPGVFSLNGSRGDTQVIMSWRRRKFK